MLKLALTGNDGAGKSTQCQLLKDALIEKGYKVRIVSAWDGLAHMGSDGLLSTQEGVQKYLMSCDARSRFLFLMHAVSRSFDDGLKSESDILILDGYWFKYALSEGVLGNDPTWIQNVCSGFERPQATFYLRLSPQDSLARKGELSQYETMGEGGADKFLKIQTKMFELMQDYSKQHEWTQIDAKNSIEVIHQELLKQTMELL
jgi:thymidylate kinase